jgi:hypothetical protein
LFSKGGFIKTIVHISLIVISAIAAFIVFLYLFIYYIIGFDYLTLNKVYSYDEIHKLAEKYSANQIFLIKREYLHEYEKGRFPKYKIYNTNGIMLNIYPCYESLPIIDSIIKKKQNDTIPDEIINIELNKIREIDGDLDWQKEILNSNKYNMIFYYKNAMDRIQRKQLNKMYKNIFYNNFKDSINLIFVNVDKVDF